MKLLAVLKNWRIFSEGAEVVSTGSTTGGKPGRPGRPGKPVTELVEVIGFGIGGKEMTGWMYILECADGTYYTGSTVNLERRLWEHENFLGANYTKKKHPVKLVYYEKYSRIDEAFYREKQVQGWSHAKKKALIENRHHDLPLLSKNYSQFGRPVVSTDVSVVSTSSTTEGGLTTGGEPVTESVVITEPVEGTGLGSVVKRIESGK